MSERTLLKKVNDLKALEAQKKANIKYRKENLKRIPLDVQKEKYEEIASAASAAGESVNGYIKKAIDQRLESDNTAQEGA